MTMSRPASGVRSTSGTTAGLVPLPLVVVCAWSTRSQSGSSTIAAQTSQRVGLVALEGVGVAITSAAPISAATLVVVLVVRFMAVCSSVVTAVVPSSRGSAPAVVGRLSIGGRSVAESRCRPGAAAAI